MTEILKYRIPGEPSVEQSGHFKAIGPHDEVNGFVISDFNQSQLFVFQEVEGEGQMSFSIDEPFVISQEEYLNQAAVFVSEIEKRNLNKAVLSRIKAVDFDGKKAEILYEKLCVEYPNAFVYLVSSALFGTWVGATPEILLQEKEGAFMTISLAGTKQSSDESPWRQKEQLEQQYVTDFLLQEIQQIENGKIDVSNPYAFQAGPVKHLRTDVFFHSKENNAFKIAQHIHPTPAVSGFPQSEALVLICETEQHQRQLYAGMIGVSEKGKSRLFVNLRCCQIQKTKAFLYLGGGFTVDSDPNEEWEETENKSKTLLNILQNL